VAAVVAAVAQMVVLADQECLLLPTLVHKEVLVAQSHRQAATLFIHLQAVVHILLNKEKFNLETNLN
jgi:hypothetical protein